MQTHVLQRMLGQYTDSLYHASAKIPYSAHCFSPRTHDWSLGQLQVEDGTPRNEEFSLQVAGIVRETTNHHGYTRVFAPNASIPTATIVENNQFTTTIPLSADVTLHNNVDLPVEGTWIGPREGVFFNTRGCSTLVFYDVHRAHVAVAHAGRDSLVDRQKLHSGVASREYENIVEAVVIEFGRRSIPPQDIRLDILFGLPPKGFVHSFTDEKYGECNKQLACALNVLGFQVIFKIQNTEVLDLHTLAKLRAVQCGIPASSINSAYRLPVNGNYAYPKHTDARMQNRSNLISVFRKAA